MQMLSDDDEDAEREPEEDFDDRDIRTAMRNKRDFEIFIGSLPTNADERQLEDFFKQKKVKITNLRVLRSNSCLIQMIKENPSALDLGSVLIETAYAVPLVLTAKNQEQKA